MKKIFALLISIWIPIYLLFGLLASCEKSAIDEDSAENSSTTSSMKTNELVGTWNLKEFFQSPGNGQGNWSDAQNAEQVSFSASGDFVANANFSQSDKKFNRYRIIDSTLLELYSTQTGDKASFHFRRENASHLIFNPLCRENCARRYTIAP